MSANLTGTIEPVAVESLGDNDQGSPINSAFNALGNQVFPFVLTQAMNDGCLLVAGAQTTAQAALTEGADRAGRRCDR